MEKYYSDKLEVGVDEVARGCLAGPVFTAAVIWPKDLDCEIENQIKDSKKLSRKKRHMLREYILKPKYILLQIYISKFKIFSIFNMCSKFFARYI